MATYIEITEENIENTISSGVSVLDFWAPWCGPCRMLSPIIDQLAVEFDGKANICKVNADDQADLLTKFGVRSVPTIVYIKDGEVVDQMIGAAATKQTITDKINSLI